MANFKPIIAKPPDKRALLNSIKNNVKRLGEKPKQDFEKTVATWEHKPVFKITVTEETGTVAFLARKIELFVGVISNWGPGKKARPNDIYMFVTRGTSERHALMSPDFSPKTKPRVIGSSAGSGGVIRVSKNLKLPGIEAREFEETITKNNTRYINDNFQKTLDEAARVSQWTIGR